MRRPQTLRAWLAAYAAATATTTSYNQILNATTPGESDKPARGTVTAYREVLAQLWLLEPVPGWAPSASPFTRPSQAPKHHLADTALAARLLAATPRSLLTTGAPGDVAPSARDGPLLGARPDRRVVAFEVKLAPSVDDGAVTHLRWLRHRIGDRLADAAVVTTGPYAYRRPDGIAVVPAPLLGPDPAPAGQREGRAATAEVNGPGSGRLLALQVLDDAVGDPHDAIDNDVLDPPLVHHPDDLGGRDPETAGCLGQAQDLSRHRVLLRSIPA